MRAWLILAFAAVLAAAGCGNPALDPAPEPIGDFRLGHLIVVADNPQQGPFSRDASREALEGAIRGEVERRLRRYDGDGLYHIGLNLEGYVLARPGIPVVYQPKSVLIVAVSVFDNETQQRLTAEPERIYAFEGLRNTAPIIGSGLARGADAQLQNLAVSLGLEIEKYLKRHPEWFAPKPGRERVAFPPPPAGTAAAPAAEGAAPAN